MNSTRRAQSATSMPRAPRDEVGKRSRSYLIMMSARMVCIIAMVLVTPYGWYTWVFGVVAVFTPYIAVVIANVGSNVARRGREDPALQITAAPEPATPTAPLPRVIRIETDTPTPSEASKRSETE